MIHKFFLKRQVSYELNGFEFVEFVPRFRIFKPSYHKKKARYKLSLWKKVVAIECGFVLDSGIHWLSNMYLMF